MKFVLFSPFSKSSAIGRVTALLVKALLASGHSATVVRTEEESRLASASQSLDVPVIPWTDDKAVEEAASEADALVYQIGNNYAFHRGGLHWLPVLPGIVCLHDFLVAHLFIEWAQGRRTEAESVLTEWYGEGAAADFFKAESAQAFIDTAVLYPMTEWICSMALSVVSHSHWGMLRVTQSCPGPLRVLPLPYDAPSCASNSIHRKSKDGLVNILTVGHVNPNKRIDSVILAIGSSPLLRSTVRYRLCGLIEPRVEAEFAKLASAHDVDLEICGETDSAMLQSAMNDAEIVCCLRWPSLEAASATAIEGLLYGKAVLVTDTAFYSELPDDCVKKIPLADEVAEIRSALEYLCTNVDERQAMAARGQNWATKTFDATKYVEHLEKLASDVAGVAPVVQMMQHLCAQMDDWGASTALMTAEDIAGPLELFGSSTAYDAPVAVQPAV